MGVYVSAIDLTYATDHSLTKLVEMLQPRVDIGVIPLRCVQPIFWHWPERGSFIKHDFELIFMFSVRVFTGVADSKDTCLWHTRRRPSFVGLAIIIDVDDPPPSPDATAWR